MSLKYFCRRKHDEREEDFVLVEGSGEELADSLDGSEHGMSDTALNISQRQKAFNNAMFVFFLTLPFFLPDFWFSNAAKKNLPAGDNIVKEKGKKRALEPLTDKTVYLEDLGPSHVPPS